MKISTQILGERLLGIANRLIFLEKKTIHQHGGLKLHPSEIHLMQVIAQDPGLNAGQMAKALGVTTGAVSQTLSRLEKKGAIVKFKDHGNKNELSARFTETGKEALKSFYLARGEESMKFAEYLESLTDADREKIAGFLARWDEFLKNLG